MTQRTNQTGRQATRRGGASGSAGGELIRAKIALVAARDRGEAGALGHILGIYPAHAPELIEFDAALIATAGYEGEALTAETERVAERALARAWASVFPAQAPLTAPLAVAQGAIASLKALRKARGLTPRALGERVGLGVDVVSNLEAGLIRVASIPDRLFRALGEALGASVDQIHHAFEIQPMVEPALRRDRRGAGGTPAKQPTLDFGDAIRFSPNMTDTQKAEWLAD
jgi:transcriptional regulator with XRE-family HTH domain